MAIEKLQTRWFLRSVNEFLRLVLGYFYPPTRPLVNQCEILSPDLLPQHHRVHLCGQTGAIIRRLNTKKHHHRLFVTFVSRTRTPLISTAKSNGEKEAMEKCNCQFLFVISPPPGHETVNFRNLPSINNTNNSTAKDNNGFPHIFEMRLNSFHGHSNRRKTKSIQFPLELFSVATLSSFHALLSNNSLSSTFLSIVVDQ